MAQIKKDTSLRKAILQAAITGQLISNVEGTTETGKQLLDRIIEERNKKLLAEWEEALKKNPKVKKPAPVVTSEIDEEEIPFDIPENWCWCRLGDVAEIKSSKRVFEKDYVLDGVPFFRSAEIGDLQQNKALKTELFISEKHFNELKNKYGVPQQGDLLITSVGTIGNTWISDGRDFYYKDGNITQISKNEFIIPEYFRLFIDSPIFTMQVFDTVAGTAYNALTIIKLKKLIFPLPPLAVQNAIVEKLEQVLPLVDAYENALLQKEELKSALPDKVKKAILQEAITGQLTENWRKSATIKESGKQLLDRIIEERNAKALADWEEALKKNPKAKKPVPVVASEIGEDEIPFEIPESWCWCHLGEICNEIKRGKSPKYVDRSDYLAFAQKCNVKTGGIDLSLALYLDEKSIDRYSEEDNLIQGDVVINSTGGGTMGRVGYYETKVPEGIKGVYPDSHVTVIRSVGNINQRYLYYILKHNQPVLEDCGTGSTNQTELKPAVLANFVIPLPPLEEQEEIVKKVEELLPLCK